MNKNTKLFIIFISSILLIYVINIKNSPPKIIEINGIAKILTGNQMPGIEDNFYPKEITKSNVKIIAIPGKISQIDGEIFLPLERIPLNAVIKETDEQGKFNMSLPQGKYTFFILKEKQAYRNSFDGKGYFTQTEVKQNINNLVLIYDKFAFY